MNTLKLNNEQKDFLCYVLNNEKNVDIIACNDNLKYFHYTHVENALDKYINKIYTSNKSNNDKIKIENLVKNVINAIFEI